MSLWVEDVKASGNQLNWTNNIGLKEINPPHQMTKIVRSRISRRKQLPTHTNIHRHTLHLPVALLGFVGLVEALQQIEASHEQEEGGVRKRGNDLEPGAAVGILAEGGHGLAVGTVGSKHGVEAEQEGQPVDEGVEGLANKSCERPG